MNRKSPFSSFQFLTLAVFFGFMSIMAFVTYTAYSRKSGHTGMSMMQIQKTRADVSVRPEK